VGPFASVAEKVSSVKNFRLVNDDDVPTYLFAIPFGLQVIRTKDL